MATASQPPLSRRLGTVDAVAIGLGSMIGAGVFAVFAPAAQVAGAWLLLGLVLAGLVAYCNAISTAQLAAQYPTSGGVYVYGRERLGPWWGFLAGWGFVVGKIASCAAISMTFAAYLAPDDWEKPVAIGAVAAITAVTCAGVTRTALLARVIAVVVLTGLGIVLAAALSGDSSDVIRSTPDPGGWYGVLQSAGLLFFAFAGYARIATMGEEVRDPERTIPRAIQIALGVTFLLYAAAAVLLLRGIGAGALAKSSEPFISAVRAADAAWAVPVVWIAAAVATLGALLGLLAGVGRTTLAMARTGDLPTPLAAVHVRHRVPHRAQIAAGVVVSLLVAVGDLREVIGFSSFGVLLYYLVANVAAFTQPSERRRFPRALQVLGAVGCVVLVVTLPTSSVLAGVAVFAVGIAYRLAQATLAARSNR